MPWSCDPHAEGEPGGRAPVIGVVVLGAPAAVATRLCEAVARQWPGTEAPQWWALAWREDIDTASLDAMLAGTSAVLVVTGAQAASRHLARIASVAAEGLVPGLVLYGDGVDPGPGLRDGALAALPDTCDPRTIAGVLFGMRSRQPTVEQMRRDLAGEAEMRSAAARQIEQMQSEVNMAVLVQREMMPKSLPELAGLDMGVLFRPGTDLSGDLYDCERLDEHHVGFLIADAAGHGAPAALMTMLIGRLLPTKEVSGKGYRIVPPGEALTRLNDAFVNRRGDMMAIVSAVYGVMDVRTGVVQIANAGHPHPLVVSPRGARALREGGPLLGMAEGVVYEQGAFVLGPDETLLVYSDGFEHAFHDSPQRATAGNELHLGVFAGLGLRGEQPLPEALRALSGRLDAQHGSLHQVDDITLLAIGRRIAEAASTAA